MCYKGPKADTYISLHPSSSPGLMARPKKGAAALSQTRPKRAAAVSNLFEPADRYIELSICYLPQVRIKTANDAPTIAPVSSEGQFAQNTSHTVHFRTLLQGHLPQDQ